MERIRRLRRRRPSAPASSSRIASHDSVMIEDHAGRKTDREYVEGLQWDSGYVSAYFCTDLDRMEAVIENPVVVSTDVNVETVEQILPILEQVMARKEEQGIGGFVLIANEISGPALAVMVANTEKKTLPCLGIKAPGAGDRRVRILEDVAILTGGRIIAEDAGDKLEEATYADVGRARRVWANRDFFSIVGGQGDPSTIRQRVSEIKKLIPDADGDYEREKMRERMGKLQGGVGILKVGAPSEREREIKKQRGEEAVAAAGRRRRKGSSPGAAPRTSPACRRSTPWRKTSRAMGRRRARTWPSACGS